MSGLLGKPTTARMEGCLAHSEQGAPQSQEKFFPPPAPGDCR